MIKFLLSLANLGISIINSQKLNSIMIDLTKITQDVTDVRSAVDAAKVLIVGLADTVSQMPATQAALDDLEAKLRSSADDLSAAVVAGTGGGTGGGGTTPPGGGGGTVDPGTGGTIPA